MRWATALGVVASIVFSILTVADFDLVDGRVVVDWLVDPGELGRALASASPMGVAYFLVLTLLTLPLRALRWGFVVEPAGRFRDRYHSTAVGFMAVNLLPARLGEIALGLSLASRVSGLSKAQAVGSVLLSRLLDLAGLLLLCLPLPFLLGLHAEAYGLLWAALGIASAVVALSALVVWLARNRGDSFAGWVGNHLGPRARRFLARFLDGLGSGFGGRRLAIAVGVSVALQLVSALAYGPLVADAAPDAPMPWAALFALAVISVGLAVPSSPSGVGVYHFVMAWALRLLGASPADAAAVAVITHLGSVVVFVSAGLVSLVAGHGGDIDAMDEARGSPVSHRT